MFNAKEKLFEEKISSRNLKPSERFVNTLALNVLKTS